MAPFVQSKIIVQTIKDFRDQRQLHFVLLFMEKRLQLPLFSAKCDCKTPLHNVWPFPNVYYCQHLLIWPWIAETKKEYPLRHARCGWHKFSKAFFLLITVKNRLLTPRSLLAKSYPWNKIRDLYYRGMIWPKDSLVQGLSQHQGVFWPNPKSQKLKFQVSFLGLNFALPQTWLAHLM